MQKETIHNISKKFPQAVKDISNHLKTNFNIAGHKTIMNASGTVGLIINLFGHSLIEGYYTRAQKKKLDDYGTPTYMVAGFEQAEDSLKFVSEMIVNEDSIEDAVKAIEDVIEEEIEKIDESEIIMVFQAKYHPAILFVKEKYTNILDKLNIDESIVNEFIKHFNNNISEKVKKVFGESYEAHLEDISELRFSEIETEFLWDMKNLGKIGFKETENLKYETTYAKWKPVEEFREIDDIDLGETKTNEEEDKLEPAERLIEDYFNFQPQNNINKILFVLGDFGKGKSVFLKHYAAKLAKNYLQTGEGLFPVYFNLRNFKNYSSEYRLGVIADYLETDYGIKIEDARYRDRNFVFLIDSLDESGDLTKTSIDKIITSVKQIQNLDKTKYRQNRIIVSSRPFDGGLYSQLKTHNPHVIKNGLSRNIEYFISLYGFTKVQFNNWIIDTLFNYPDFLKLKASGLAQKIQENIEDLKYIDVYDELLSNGTLSRSELRRPIFAYMIFKLLINNIDFYKVGKIGVYLSFINLLTKEAKYIEDNVHIDLNKEFEFRNILHSIASLSMYEWQNGRQWKLKKADICRVLDGEITSETDEEILERYKNQGVLEIEFLSHSYFGENNNILHFQHQSFAEILLAEYYLKVFIKFALDEDFDVEKARTKLMIGVPTGQTIQFLVEMLRLLRSSASENINDKLIQKRKLLFPLISSLATKKHNHLFCHDIYYEWYKKINIPFNSSEYPQESLENWFFTQEKIDRIINLASEIIDSKQNYLLVKGKSLTALYDKEIFAIQKNITRNLPPDTDKWLALLVGNILYNNEGQEKYFNSTIEKYENLFEMIRNWNYYSISDSSPYWAKSLFKGINMDSNEDEYNFSNSNLSGINFSHSNFKLINMSTSRLNGCIFEDVRFQDVDFSFSDLTNSYFSGIRSISGTFDIGFTILGPEIFLPPQLAKKFFDSGFMGSQLSFIPESGFSSIKQIYETLNGILKYGIDNQLFSKDECVTWFKFETDHIEDLFKRQLRLLS
ncbi:MAG: NACHT domain-containing protein [Bacteroidales bacterium]|nr:NACHT domain-containing protein [Bacteroidales bacterium]